MCVEAYYAATEVLACIHCTIFCKRVNARAEIRHTNPLQCSDCKNILQSEHSKGSVWRISARALRACKRLCNVNAALDSNKTFWRVWNPLCSQLNCGLPQDILKESKRCNICLWKCIWKYGSDVIGGVNKAFLTFGTPSLVVLHIFVVLEYEILVLQICYPHKIKFTNTKIMKICS